MIAKCTCGFAPAIDRSVDPFTQYATHQMEVGLHIMMAALLHLPGRHESVKVEQLVERSSLGTPGAKAARQTVSDAEAARVVRKSYRA